MEEISKGSQEAERKCCLAFPRNPAHHMKSRGSRKSGLRLPRIDAMIAVTLPETNRTPITNYTVIATGMNIDGLLDVRR